MKNLSLSTMFFLLATALFADPLGTHGMLLFGKKNNYVSHLPMFHSPHDYQLVAEVTITNQGNAQTVAKYEKAKKQSDIFTIVPEPMDLAKVVSGEIRSFPVEIYQGHFERGGTPIGKATVAIKQTIVAKKIVAELGASQNYISFGHDGEYFLAHLIYGKPTYDAIYTIARPTKLFYPPCGRGVCGEPKVVPINDSYLPREVKAENSLFGIRHPEHIAIGDVDDIAVFVDKPFYVEYNELTH